jgi:hypothetical protein
MTTQLYKSRTCSVADQRLFKWCFGIDCDSVVHGQCCRFSAVGGVLLTILILVLALSPPDGSRAPLSGALATGRGVLADRDHQSEVRQFLLHAALKRADELNRLRDLPDTPTRSEVEDTTPKVAGRPSNRSDSDPEEAATINETPVVELLAVVPQAQPQEMAPAAKKAEPAKPQREPTAASIAHATPKSQRSRRRLASTLSLKCFSGDRRLNNRHTATNLRTASCQPTPSRAVSTNISQRTPSKPVGSGIIRGRQPVPRRRQASTLTPRLPVLLPTRASRNSRDH